MTNKPEFIPKKKYKTKYSPEMCDQIIQIAMEGGGVAKMCSVIGIKSRDTFYRWLEEYPEFGEAYKTAKTENLALMEDIGLKGMMGQIKNFNFSLWAMMMNNRHHEEYKRSSNGGGTEINIGAINSIEKLDMGKLEERLNLVKQKLSLLSTGESDDDQ